MRIFKIVFLNQGKVYEIFARSVRQGELYGFVEVEDLIFQDSSSLVVDPSAERLKEEFAGVHRTRIPIHHCESALPVAPAILRIALFSTADRVRHAQQPPTLNPDSLPGSRRLL
ncbi:MAG: DUF1820 family protein [Candidatus Thiodiazotropha sp.]